MEFLHAIVLGIVEGISEFLPISSTGHLILTSNLLGLNSSDFLSSFEIFIQLGAILSVVALYSKRALKSRRLYKIVGVAFLPVVVVGLVLYKVIKSVFFSNLQIVLTALFLGGIALIIFELLHKEGPEATDDLEQISYKQAVIIGLFQCLAVIPGVSRAAATIIGGLVMGLKRRVVIEFSFLLAVPTMLGATVLDLSKASFSFTTSQWLVLATGFITSFIVAYASIKFLLKFIRTHTFIPFGVYRIIIALLFWFVVLK